MSILVHHLDYSRSIRVLWMLEELGVPYELVLVDRTQAAHKSAAYLALNPNGKIPAIYDPDGPGGAPLFEWLEVRPFLTEPPTVTE